MSTAAPDTQAAPAGAAPVTRNLSILHETIYRYATPVQRSSHRLRLEPVQDASQVLWAYDLDLSVDGVRREYEDVFGNRVLMMEITQPFTEFIVRSRARVQVRGQDPSQLASPLRREQLPLMWMPWQRQMMLPYLLPPELPESELLALSDYAMTFVERNHHDLLETLLDMNGTLYRDFTYVPDSTTVETTAFEVYRSRRGVCQDFANLLICLTRLLHVPARYRVGYIHTGGSYENKIQSEASHAWVEVYLPWTGWRGFDPTNGCLVGADHVRVACGRHFWDATPTSGTLYQGGTGETLSARVEVEQVD